MQKPLFLALLCGLFFLPRLFSQTFMAGFTYDGLPRDYRLYVPEGYDGLEPWPLVLNLHGYTSNALQQQLYTEMDMVADTGHFLVCYPNGVGNSWNVGFGGLNTDDVGFINALLDTLMAHYLIDPERVYSCGMSNGGFMSYKLACELTERFAAVASVTGSMVPDEAALCMPVGPAPVLEIHGTADLVVPYNGLFNSLSIPDLLTFWTGKNGCTVDPFVIPVPNTNLLDGSTAELVQYNDCEGEAEVWHYKVYNGGHTWPGASIIAGITNQDFHASAAIWEFFLRHPGTGPSAVGEEKEKNEVFAFPNPFSGMLNVRKAGSREEVATIWNQLGEPIWRGHIWQETQIDTQDWPAGIYWLQAGSRVTALIKN